MKTKNAAAADTVTMTRAELEAMLASSGQKAAAAAAKAEKTAKATIAIARRTVGFHPLPLTSKDRERNVCGSAVHVIPGVGRIAARVRIVRKPDGTYGPDFQYGNGTAFSAGLVATSPEGMARVIAAMADHVAQTTEYLAGEYDRLSPDWTFNTRAPAEDDAGE
jgi:hypothetical protein